MHEGELSPIKWDAAKRHMTPLVRSWPRVLKADPVMQQNMTLLSFFFFNFPFSLSFFLSWQPQRCSSLTESEAAIAARIKRFGLQLRLPLQFLLSLIQSVFSSSVFPFCHPFSFLPSVSFLSLLPHSRVLSLNRFTVSTKTFFHFFFFFFWLLHTRLPICVLPALFCPTPPTLFFVFYLLYHLPPSFPTSPLAAAGSLAKYFKQTHK